MKYLQLHKLIWLMLVLIPTFFEMLFVALCYALYIIWNFKLSFPFKEMWEDIHYKGGVVTLSKDCKIKVIKGRTDYSIKETIMRRYHILFN